MRPAPAPDRSVLVWSEHPVALRQLVVPSEDLSEEEVCLETRVVDGPRIGRIKCPRDGFHMGRNRALLASLGPVRVGMHAFQQSNWDLKGFLHLRLYPADQPMMVMNFGVVYRLGFERKYRDRIRWEAEDLLREVLAGHAIEPAERIVRHLTATPTKHKTGEELED